MMAMAGIIRFYQSDQGAVAVEYGLLLAFMVLAVIGAVTIFGQTVYHNLYEDVVMKLPF